MSAQTGGPIELPTQPLDKEFEEQIASYLQCAGLYVERNIVERDVTEVLELDIITSDYDSCPPDIRLVEIKSGGWGFPDIFKINGWLRYLEMTRGALVVKTPKDTAEAQTFYESKAKGLGIDLAVSGTADGTADTLATVVLSGKTVNPKDHELWRYSYWLERNLIRRLISKKKSVQGVKRFIAMEEYLFAVNSGVFFTQGAVNRAQELYRAFQKYPRISAKCANEEAGKDFDDSAEAVDNAIFKKTFYECSLTDIQISTYIEHRARLVILKNAVDHVLYELAGEPIKAGAKTTKLLGFNFANAPDSFLKALSEISEHKYFYRYPIFWQWFLWLFGGFILKDYEADEYAALSSRTGIPVEEIPNALASYGIMFPLPGGWFNDQPHSNIRLMKMFPVPFMGIGANLRKNLYTADDDFSQLKLTGIHTRNDLAKWNNLAYGVLSQTKM